MGIGDAGGGRCSGCGHAVGTVVFGFRTYSKDLQLGFANPCIRGSVFLVFPYCSTTREDKRNAEKRFHAD
jgi:hypothetical protein